MTDADTRSALASDSLEREKWEAERSFRERELAIKEHEQATGDAQLALAQRAHAAARWRSPVVVAILAAAVAAGGNALVAYTNAASQTRLEAQKAEEARILEMIKTDSPDTAAQNLRFLVQVGLVTDATVRRKLTTFLDDRAPGGGPSLPSATGAAELVSKFEGTQIRPYTDPVGTKLIGSGHVLTRRELRSGTLLIGGKRVEFRSGITQEQANQLWPRILNRCGKQLTLVTVELTENQEAALTSFVSNLGLGAFRSSNLLRKLNAGKYNEVPHEMMKWVRAGGRTMPGLVARRKSEVEWWNR